MGFAGRPASHSTSMLSRARRSTSGMSSLGSIGATRSGGVRVRRRRGRGRRGFSHPRRSRIEIEMMRDMMETNRAMRYAMMARAMQ